MWTGRPSPTWYRSRTCSSWRFFFSSRRRHTRWPRDWSSDVCSSDLLTPAKLGQLEFPAELKLTMQWPQRGRQRRSPFDVFGMDDSFGSFFPDPFANYTDPTDVTIRSNTVALEVKPLPPNAPPGFSGAVGNFTMSIEAKPTSVQTGDPI